MEIKFISTRLFVPLHIKLIHGGRYKKKRRKTVYILETSRRHYPVYLKFVVTSLPVSRSLNRARNSNHLAVLESVYIGETAARVMPAEGVRENSAVVLEPTHG